MAESFKTLDPADVWAALEGHTDVLSGEAKKEEAFLRTCRCPGCRSPEHASFLDPSRVYAPGALLPTRYLRCRRCDMEWDPRSGLILRASRA